MSQSRRTIEQLLRQGSLPISNTDKAAIHLEVYPTKRTWLAFFDKAALIIGAVALVLALVFFVAYNWQNMGKIGKFALVEGALAITIALYVALSFKQRFKLIRQLLLLIASVITGSLLALFGQVYQTGADTWQLFFTWALLISPWVLIARFPALWLLWLGLINAALTLSFAVIDLGFVSYLCESILQISFVALVNLIALNLWLFFIDKQVIDNERLPLANTTFPVKTELHWSTYVVGAVSTFFMTYLAIFPIFENGIFVATVVTLLFWLGWCYFMIWRFYKRSINLLMLTYLCGSVIAVVMSWIIELFPDNWDIGGFLFLALLLIGMSSISVTWLRSVNRIDATNIESDLDAVELSEQLRGDYE